jgi:predicted alpha/beta superfamily hydrolase
MTRQTIVSIVFLVVAYSSFAQYTVRISVDSSAKFYSSDSNLYLAGSFNGWNPKDKNFRLQKGVNGNYFIEKKFDMANYEFKITRGSWDKVESRKDGTDIPNRSFKLLSDTTINVTIEGWSDQSLKKPRASTASKNVHIIDTAFLIPQLNRTRRVWIYLPPDYSASQKRFPVLYMQDGQNIFDDTSSYAGEWGIDETLDSIGKHTKEIIVVAIDHGGAKRINEYCPYDMVKYGEGEGGLYIDFLVKTLKSFIDKKYRTLKDKANTFIAGSSMGGLISMYAVLKYPAVFGGAGVFSPAFWVGPQIFDDILKKGKEVHSKIYFYCGGQEGETMEPDMEKAFEEMRKVSNSRMISNIRPDGKHSESAWREEFPLFYLWLMEK